MNNFKFHFKHFSLKEQHDFSFGGKIVSVQNTNIKIACAISTLNVKYIMSNTSIICQTMCIYQLFLK